MATEAHALTLEAAKAIVANGAGRKVLCPICGKRCMSQLGLPFKNSGIGLHIRSAHPEQLATVIAVSGRLEREEKERALAEAKEAQERPLRHHTLLGSELDEIIEELRSLISMMEPYYSQSDADASAQALIARLEARASLSKAPAA